MDERRVKVGELAERAGLTVRTLHHWDEIGLLSPSERTDGGHRAYTRGDLARLSRVLALRQLGLPLDEIAARLEAVLAALDADASASTDDLIETIEVMTEMERYYTGEQLAKLAERADEAPTGQAAWAELIADVRAAMAEGVAPAEPRAKRLAERWDALIEAFTGGDPGIRAGLQRLYEEQGPQQASRGMVDAEMSAWVQAARDA